MNENGTCEFRLRKRGRLEYVFILRGDDCGQKTQKYEPKVDEVWALGLGD